MNAVAGRPRRCAYCPPNGQEPCAVCTLVAMAEPWVESDASPSPERVAAATVTTDLAPGESFGRYELLHLLGRGAMGQVWAARDPVLDRLVALKVILPERASSLRYIRYFEQEAATAAKPAHPSAIPVYEAGQVGGRHYFTMELIEGEALDKLANGASLEPRVAAAYARAVALQLSALHVRGFIHRDVKPANILLDSSDRPRLTDFGLAQRAAPDAGATSRGPGAGTSRYMAPEQAQGLAVDVRTDVYGLGATLYQLLTGAAPFQAQHKSDVLRLVRDAPLTRPRAVNASIPRHLEYICLCCLEKDPAKRYPSMDALAEDLRLFSSDYPARTFVRACGDRAYSRYTVLGRGAGHELDLVLVVDDCGVVRRRPIGRAHPPLHEYPSAGTIEARGRR